MQVRIAYTFTDSLARLTAEEQKAAKVTALDLLTGVKGNGLQFHRLDHARDRNFHSVRVTRDLRLIVHKVDAALLLLYVGHHDKAYAWAERRRLDVHPATGAAQLVELRETVREIVRPVYTTVEQPVPGPPSPPPPSLPPPSQPPPPPPAPSARAGGTGAARSTDAPVPRPPPLALVADDDLLAYGVPAEWLRDVKAATDHTLWAVVEHLPAEAREAVLDLATGGRPPKPVPATPSADPFEHPDARRRFRVVANADEMQAALDAPWDKWAVFLHPDQRAWVERDFAGPARVAGSAGTGKTVVALHRAVFLAKAQPDARVLLTTFSDTLASALRVQLRRLLASEPRLGERIEVHGLPALGLRLYRAHVGPAQLAGPQVVEGLVREAAAAEPGCKASLRFLLGEWEHVVDAWQVAGWEAYRDVARLGRKTRLPEAQRRAAWGVFARVHEALRQRGLVTAAGLFTTLAQRIAQGGKVLFDVAVVDESQDLGVPHLRFLAALGGTRPNALFFSGDLGQRIFQQPFSWKSLGVDVRGRSRTLRVNYRTSHQIRTYADRLLGHAVTDADGNVEERRGTVSVFDGPPPRVEVLPDEAAEARAVGDWLRACAQGGVAPHEMAVVVRSEAQLARARAAVEHAAVPCQVLDESIECAPGHVALCTMHRAKGLEFRAVAVIACDDDILPLRERMEAVGDTGDLADVYDTERQLLYVACTRARDQLLVTAVGPASEFLDDLTTAPPPR